MELHIVIEGKRELAEQVYRQLREAIVSGRLADRERLPPSRLLAEQLGVSRKTVSEAYARLTLDQLLVGQVGVGSFVQAPTTTRPRKIGADQLSGGTCLQRWTHAALPLRHPAPEGQSRYEFIGGAASVPFPLDDWRRCLLHALRQDRQTRGRYSAAEGLPDARVAVARHAAFTRGIDCRPDDVIITNGAQQALDLVARVLVEPGSTVAVEEPGYPPARLLFASQGARVVGIPVDAEGMVVDRIPPGTRLIYVTPAHQFPLGMPMSAGRRHALLERAYQLGALVIEDDYDSAFRYEGRPTDALQSMDRRGSVAHVGTFSKTLLPELRLGYLVAPPAIREPVAVAKPLTDWHTATTMQGALARFIDDGCLQKHIRRCHAIYASRRERMVHRLDGDLAPWLELIPANAGFHLSAFFRKPIDMALLLRLARRVELGLYSLAPFYQCSPARSGLFFGYGMIDTLDIDFALDRLKELLIQLDAAAPA